MAQGDSIVGICNAALIALGEDVITSLNDPTKAAILCSAKYDQERRELLASQPWACAKKQASLAANPTAPIFGWNNAYPLPADYIRMWDMDDQRGWSNPKWEIQGDQILTDEDAPLNIEYIYDLQDPTLFSPLFAKTLALALAKVLAEPLTQSTERKQTVSKDEMEAKEAARLVDSQNDGPRELEEDVWLRSRH